MSTSAQPTPTSAPAAYSAPGTKTHEPAKAHSHKQSRKKFTVGRALGFTAAAAVVLWLGSIGLSAYRYAKTDDAYVVGHLHEISSQVDGRVQEVYARNNQAVKAGDPLLKIEPLPFEIAVQKSEAAVAQATAHEQEVVAAAAVAASKRNEAAAHVTQTVAQVSQAKAQFDLAQQDYDRAEKLMQAGGVSSQAELDAARGARNSAQGAFDAANADNAAALAAVTSADAAVAGAASQADVARAATASANADLREARRRLAETAIAAPADGRIGNRNVEAGNQVQPGQPLFALAENETWIIANFKETDIGRFKSGEAADVTIDALPSLQLHGTIDSISPASGAQFALLPPDNATGNFTKVVQRVPVKIILDDASLQAAGPALRLGYSAVVKIRIR